MFCSKCGSQISDNANFCNKCGAKIGASEVGLVVNSTAEKPKKPKSLVKKIGLIVGAIFTVIILISLFSSGYNKPVVVIVDQIAEEYMKDSVAADKKWKNKKIELLGAVIETGQFSDTKGDYIEFHTLYRNDFDEFTVLASVEDKSELGNIKKNDFVKVDGELIGYGKQKNGTATVQIKGKSIKKLSEKEIKTEMESYIEQEAEKLPAGEREQFRQFFKNMLNDLAVFDTSNDSSKKSSESPAPGQTAAKSNRQIDQNALNALYGEWGYHKSEPYVTFKKEDVGRDFEVIEAVVNKGSETSYRLKLKMIKAKDPYIAEIDIFNGGRGYGGELIMTIHDATNNQDLVTLDEPYVKAKKR